MRRSVPALIGVLSVALAATLAGAAPAIGAPKSKPPKTVSFQSSTYTVIEGEGSRCVYVERSVTKGKSPSVTVTTTDGTATAGTDYTSLNTTVTFPRRDRQVAVCVPVLVDRVTGESDETVNLTVTTSSRGWEVGTLNTTTLTIQEMPVPTEPRSLTADVGFGSVHLTWTAPTSGPVDHYWVGSSTTSGGPYTELGTTTGTSYDVTPAPSVDTYYVVEAVNPDTAASGYSNEAVGAGFELGSGLFWTLWGDGAVMAANPDGSNVNTLVSGVSGAFGVAVDASHIYWSQYSPTNTINRANPDGTGTITLVSGPPAVDNPRGVAVDSNYIYWANYTGGEIMRADLDGTNVTTLVSDQNSPAGLAVDGSHIYWTSVATTDGKVMRADLNGTNVTTLASGQDNPWAVAVDDTYVYWANAAGNGDDSGTINRAPLTNPSNVTTLVSGQGHPVGLAVDANYIYWANDVGSTINRADLNGSTVETLVTGQNNAGAVALAPSSS